MDVYNFHFKKNIYIYNFVGSQIEKTRVTKERYRRDVKKGECW